MIQRRILLVNWNDRTNPWGGGAEVHLHETFGRLAAAGHEITFLCSGFPGGAPEETLDGMRIVRVGGRHTFSLVAPGEVRRRVRRDGFEVIVEALNKIPLATPAVGVAPVLGIGHHLFGATIFREAPPPASFAVFASELALPWIYRKTPMAVISESTREDFIARGLSPKRLRVVHVGVDHERYRPDPGTARETCPTFLALGRVRKYKRLELVIDAVAELARGKHSELRLVVAGTGSHLDALKAFVKRRGVERFVSFTGYVDEKKKVELYRKAWALVMTSPKEGWGLTCLEAQACGTPVLASDSPGLREAVRGEESGLLVPHGDRRALALAMDRFLSDAALRAKLAAGAIRFANTFTWERCAAETLEMIEGTMAANRRDA